MSKDKKSNEFDGNIKEIKLGFFKRVKLSVIDFDKYHIVAAEKPVRTLLYLLKMFIIFALIVTLALTYKVSTIINKVSNYIGNDTPNFYLQEGTFTIDTEEPFIIENDEYIKMKLILSNETSYNKFSEDIENNNELLIILLKNEVFIENEDGNFTTYNYEQIQSQYGMPNISKDNVLDLLGNRTIYITLFIYLMVITFITYFSSMLIDVLALSVLGLIIAKLARLPLKFSALFSMAASSITLPVILNIIYVLLNVFTGFTMPEFQIMYTLISYIYLIASILIMRSNLLKNKTNIIREIAEIKKQETKDEEVEN